MRAAFRGIAPVALLAVLPTAVAIGMFVVGVVTGPLADDFRNELYPQAEEILAGRNPYPVSLWPPLAVAAAIPFTLLPSTAAGIAIGIAGLACMALALWLVGVRDWRVVRRGRAVAAGHRRHPHRAPARRSSVSSRRSSGATGPAGNGGLALGVAGG